MITSTERGTGESISVGMAEIGIAFGPNDVLIARGVGSCVIVCAWDPKTGVGAMAHVVQPRDPAATVTGNVRYADQAVPVLLEQLQTAGAERRRLVIKLAGGASLLQQTRRNGEEPLGTQNVRAVEAALLRYALVARGSSVGGTFGRTVTLELATGRLRVRTLGQGETVI
jgi:chemotaxis protein CheD